MRGQVLAAAIEVVAEALHDLEAEGQLLLLVVAAVQAGRRGLRVLVADGAEQGHDGGAELGEEGAQLPRRHAGLAAVEQRVVGLDVIAERVGQATVEVDVGLQEGREGGEVRLAAGLGPGGAAERTRFADRRHKLGGQAPLAVVLAPRDAHQARVVGIRVGRFHLRLEGVEQAADLVGGEAHVGEAAQGGQLLRAGLHAAGRHVGDLVPAEDLRGVLQIADLGQDGAELFHRCGHRCLLGIGRARPGPRRNTPL